MLAGDACLVSRNKIEYFHFRKAVLNGAVSMFNHGFNLYPHWFVKCSLLGFQFVPGF